MRTLIMTCLIVLLVKDGEFSGCDADTRFYNKDNIKIDFYKECALSAKPCLVKCCALGEVIYYRAENHTCKSIEEADKILNFTDAIKAEIKTYAKLKILKVDGSASEKQFFEDFNILHRNQFNQSALIFYQGNTNFTDDGNAVFKRNDVIKTQSELYINSPNFCVDIVVGSRNNAPVSTYKYFVQLDDNCQKNTRALFLIYGNLASAFFCFLILVVYKLLEKAVFCKLYDKLTMAFIASLMVYAALFAVQIIIQYNKPTEYVVKKLANICIWLAPIRYFFILSTHFWMSAMAFNVWHGIRNYLGTYWEQNRTHPRKYTKKLFCYSLYALGVPTVLTAIAVSIDNADLPSTVVKPNFKYCQPDDPSNMFVRLYIQIPILFVVVSNMGFFVATIINIIKFKRGISMMTKISKQEECSSVAMFIRLSVVMGINWVFELVQAPIRDLPLYGFILLNLWNTCLGVLLFIVTLCKRDVFVKLCQRFHIENRWTPQPSFTANTRDTKWSKSISRQNSNESNGLINKGKSIATFVATNPDPA